MPYLDLPDEPTNELKLADWLEIYALISADENSSMGDLEQALRIASVLEAQGRNAIEAKCLEVFSELEQRSIAADDAYPFLIDGATLSVKPQRETYAGYVFCLCLSYFRWNAARSKEIPINPWLLFEELSCIAAEQFVHGEVLSFGTARGKSAKAIRSFREKVNELCRRLGEGKGFKEQDILSCKDDHVDLVAWRDFKDRCSSKLVIFGQCAGGDDWKKGKDSELKPQAFWDQWMLEGKVSTLLRSFYIPHRIPRKNWDHHARRAGILFDRCRVAYWAFRNNDAVLANPNFKEWYQFALRPSPPRKKRKRAKAAQTAKARKAMKKSSKTIVRQSN